MLTQIKTGAAPRFASLDEALAHGNAAGPIGLLLSCHERIRHFTALAVRLATAGAPDLEISAAAAAVHRYYTVALPLHEADENESVYPRLRAGLPPGELADANQAMLDQHRDLDELIAQLVPLWAAVVQAPLERAATRELAERLQAMWSEHLELEERVIFPALRQHLAAGDHTAIRAEMVGRRRTAS